MKTKKLLCSFLSIVMALAFVLPVLPGAPAAEAAVGTSYVYDFTNLTASSAVATNLTASSTVGKTFGTAGDTSDMPFTLSKLQTPRKENAYPVIRVTKNGPNFVEAAANDGTGQNPYAPGFWVQFDFTVPENGEYNAVLDFGNINDGNTISELFVYLAPKDADDPVSNQYLVDVVNNCTKDSNNTNTQRTLSSTEMLAAGDYSLSLMVRGSYKGKYIHAKDFTLTKIGEYVAPVRYTYNFAQKLDTATTLSAGASYGSNETAHDMKWTVCDGNTGTAKIINYNYVFNTSNGWTYEYCKYLEVKKASTDNHYFSVKVNVPEAGTYDVESLFWWNHATASAFSDVANLYIVPADEANVTKTKVDTYNLSTYLSNYSYTYDDAYATTYAKTSDLHIVRKRDNIGSVEIEEAGDYIITYELVDSAEKADAIRLDSLRLTRTSAPAEPEEDPVEANDIFGSKYAYVQKADDGTYTLSFVGGLNDINYAKVGFEINGDKDNVAYTTSVYDSLSVNGTSYAASAYEADYVFCATKAGFEPGATVTIKPYVEDADGNRTYHEYSETEDVEFTFTLPEA